MDEDPDPFDELAGAVDDEVRIITVADDDLGVITAVIEPDGSVLLTMVG